MQQPKPESPHEEEKESQMQTRQQGQGQGQHLQECGQDHLTGLGDKSLKQDPRQGHHSQDQEHDQQEHETNVNKPDKKQARIEMGEKEKEQVAAQQEPQQDHFFSALADRNLDHVLGKIVSYLPGGDVRSCLWTCRVLRHAAMSNRKAMKRECDAFGCQRFLDLPQTDLLKPKKVLDPFSTYWLDECSLIKKLGETTEREAGDILEKVVRKETVGKPEKVKSPIGYSFGPDYEDQLVTSLGFGDKKDWVLTPIEMGDLIMLERKYDGKESTKTTECWLIRMDSEGGRILDKWDYLDIVDKDDDLLKETSYGEVENLGASFRRGNKVFYVQRKYWGPSKHAFNNDKAFDEAYPSWPEYDRYTLLMNHKCYIFALMVDLDKNKVLWKKRVGYDYDWKNNCLFMTDTVCGFIQNSREESSSGDYKPKRLMRFDVETGAEMLPDLSDGLLQVCSSDNMTSITAGCEMVALVSQVTEDIDVPSTESDSFTCQLLQASNGFPVSHFYLTITGDRLQRGNGRDILFLEQQEMPTSVLFVDRVLAMCICPCTLTSYGHYTENKEVHFAFWDLTKKEQIVKYSWQEEGSKVDAYVVGARVITLTGFDNVGPSVTGSIWFLLSSEKREGDEFDCTLHSVCLNRSVSAFWEWNSNLSLK